MRFSIIIPVYNTAKYLRKCVDSVLEQVFDDFEIVLVDDGSPDDAGKICDEYAEKFGKVLVVHQKNGGLSSARNSGLQIIQGEYVLFLDSDDYWCNSNALKNLNERIDLFDEDLVLYSCDNLYPDGTKLRSRGTYDLEILDLHEKKRTLEYLISSNKMPGAAWVMAVKTDLIKKNNFQFPLNVTAEDYVWVLSILNVCERIGAINDDFYIYVKRDGSITSSAKLSGIKGLALALDYAAEKGLVNSYSVLKKYLRRMFYLMVMSFNALPKKDKKEAADLIKKYVWTAPFYVKTVLNIFGVGFPSYFVNKTYHLLKR